MNKSIKAILTAIIIIITIAVGCLYDNNNKKIFGQVHYNRQQNESVSNTQQKETNTENQVVKNQDLINKNSNAQTISNKELSEKQPSRGSNIDDKFDITLTFYSGLEEENGGFKDINCSGQKLQPGMVANNVLAQGTKIYTKEFGILTVADKGGSNFNTIHRLDVYVPRKSGESDEAYKKRVNNMGKVKVLGYIVKY